MGWDMRIRHFAWNLALAGALILAAGAQAAPLTKETWIGAWGFVSTPLPPGTTPALAPANPSVIPLAPGQAMPVNPPAPTPPLLDTPGNVPVLIADSDPSNVTIRQLVRVAVAGKRIRLRFSNEAGSDALTLGAVHVGAAGPDGSVIAGSDRVVTFDGKPGITIPASAPLLSDPIDLKVEALEKLVISVHIPGPFSRTGHSLFQYVAGMPGNHTAAASLPPPEWRERPTLPWPTRATHETPSANHRAADQSSACCSGQ